MTILRRQMKRNWTLQRREIALLLANQNPDFWSNMPFPIPFGDKQILGCNRNDPLQRKVVVSSV